MSNPLRKVFFAAFTALSLLLSPLALSHFNDKEPAQSFRQSWFALVAASSGPLFSMLKGEMPWSQEQVAASADQLVALNSIDVSRFFADGTDKGTTRAKPEIWSNQADFQAKMDDLRAATLALQAAAAGGERKATTGAIAGLGKSCKSCHDEYKSEDYLY